jgi:hypothetical protein
MALAICLHCVQAAAPVWPLVIFWPIVKIKFVNSFSRFTRRASAQCRKLRREMGNDSGSED